MSVLNLLLNAHICVLSVFKRGQVCLYLDGVKRPKKPPRALKNFLCVFLIFDNLSGLFLAYRKTRVIRLNYKIGRRVRVDPKTDFYRAFFGIHSGRFKILISAGFGRFGKGLFWRLFGDFLSP